MSALDRKELSRELLEAEEQERRRIARELHDSTGQLLTAAELVLTQAERGGGDVYSSIRRARNIIAQARNEIRTMSFLLHPPHLLGEGLAATLATFAEGFGRRSGLKVSVLIEGNPRSIGAAVELAFFRIAQEALHNIYKHARASEAQLRLQFGENSLCLEVEDNGPVPDTTEDLKPGVGLSSMHVRMLQLGGTLTLTRRDAGVIVRAHAPV